MHRDSAASFDTSVRFPGKEHCRIAQKKPLTFFTLTNSRSPNLDGGVVKVRVKNQGTTATAPCYMAIRVTPLGGAMKVFSPKIPAIAAGQEVYVEAPTGFLLSQADYEAIVDRSTTVIESNEKNNSLKGKFGGKP